VTPTEAVLWDAMLAAGYTERQAARALVALSLSEPPGPGLGEGADRYGSLVRHRFTVDELTAEAMRRGLL
jgi:hypothetical protein